MDSVIDQIAGVQVLMRDRHTQDCEGAPVFLAQWRRESLGGAERCANLPSGKKVLRFSKEILRELHFEE